MHIALCRPDRVGDVLLATACLEPIRQQLPGVRLTFLAREVMRPLLENHPLLDGFLALPAAGGGLLANSRALAESLRAIRPDALVHLHPDAVAQLAGWRAGVPRRVGYANAWLLDRTLSRRFPDRRALGRKHEAEANFDLLAPFNVRPPGSADELRLRVALPDRWHESLRAKIGGPLPPAYVALNPTAFQPTLRWPPAYFAQLARDLRAARPELSMVLVAERADHPSVLEIQRELGPVPWLRDLAGRTNLAELGGLLRGARALVSRDTGTSHLAAAVGCPVVQIFGRLEPTYGPGRWRALGEPGRIRVLTARPGPRRRWETRRAFWRRAYTTVLPAEVLAAVLDLLGGNPAP